MFCFFLNEEHVFQNAQLTQRYWYKHHILVNIYVQLCGFNPLLQQTVCNFINHMLVLQCSIAHM